ncbi:S8 family serine peptidase [Couchioplanes caeruleus]|uniref:Type VII secretion-associated serine protease mycosin n=1 Tax=Couchioplanes caeruleus TaxID=56438 RepID=A0A3N1GEY1_9ACTN|nr:S8 family serine peptidase [Couchioplanes caeruleus]ROP28863.1 type VII secretion-associated serine protease mycosin [Couchioplanes caeruleus]
MSLVMRRFAVAAVAAGALAAAVATVPSSVATTAPPVASGAAPVWTPVTSGLTESPDELLPERISADEPVSIVSTVRDATGRPVVTTRRATGREQAQRLIRAGQRAPGALAVELDAPVRKLDVPTGTDPLRGSQWDFAKLRIATAWQRSTGAGVTVAVIDSGVEATHPDLAGRVLPGVDLVAGTSGTSSDPNGHGTHVAGTIAAVTGNGVGVSAIAPDARILPVRALDAQGSGLMSDVATGIVYAADHGAQVINMSLGSSSQVASVSNAIAYARAHGVVVVAAAGNFRDAGSPTSWPAADEGVIAVASTDSTDGYSSFSNRGSYVDVAAPGSLIFSTVPVATGTYGYMSGTSMASPHVAAVAALLKGADAALTPDAIEQALTATATDLGAAGRDPDYGFGRINPVEALATVATESAPTTPPATDPVVSPTTPTAVPPTTAQPSPSETATATPDPVTTPTSSPTATPVPSGTPAPGVTTPVVTGKGSARTVDYGTVVTTTFTVTAEGRPWARQRASICVAAAIGGFRCAATTTSDGGTVRYTRAVTSRYSVRLVVSATASSHQVSSATFAYVPRAVVRLAKSGKGALTATIRGATRQTASLQRYDGRSWVTVVAYRATERRTVSRLRTGWRYRAVVGTTAAVAGAVSATVRL